MNDYLPPIHIKINVPPRRFLDRMAQIAETSEKFRVEKHYDALGQKSFDVVNLRYEGKSPHRNVGGQLIADPKDEGAVAVEMRAQRWTQRDLPTYDTYSGAAKDRTAPSHLQLTVSYAIPHVHLGEGEARAEASPTVRQAISAIHSPCQ
jgi:hypothetical protein